MNNKTIICIVVALGVVISWYMGITNAMSESNGYDAYIRTAQKYEEEQLYEKAIGEYKSALAYEDTLALRMKIVDMYKAGIEIGEITSDGNLVAMLLDTMSVYRENTEPFEVSCEYFLSVLNYDELVDALKVADDYNLNSSKIKEIRTKVRYLYEKNYATLSEPSRLTNGYYIINDRDNKYSISHELDKGQDYCDFIAPYSKDGSTVIKKTGKVFILGNDGIRQKYLDDNITASSGIADGNIACQLNGKWAYYNLNGEKISNDYVFASRFAYGVAAVQTGEGKWQLINTEFKPLSEAVYEDVKLNSEQACASDGIVFVKTNGKYEMIAISDYTAENPSKVKIEAVKGFSCIDCDLPADPEINSNNGLTWFAFKDEATQKWGYADSKGKVTIKPNFEEAKSFSNDFAAVLEGDFWCFINEDGEIVVRPEVTNAGYFNQHGCCMVQYEKGYWSYIRMYYWDE